jgi:hypothetical protein
MSHRTDPRQQQYDGGGGGFPQNGHHHHGGPMTAGPPPSARPPPQRQQQPTPSPAPLRCNRCRKPPSTKSICVGSCGCFFCNGKHHRGMRCNDVEFSGLGPESIAKTKPDPLVLLQVNGAFWLCRPVDYFVEAQRPIFRFSFGSLILKSALWSPIRVRRTMLRDEHCLSHLQVSVQEGRRNPSDPTGRSAASRFRP